MSDELKTCPFCGGEARLNIATGLRNNNTYYYVECTNENDNCLVQPETADRDTLSEAVKIWNTRVNK